MLFSSESDAFRAIDGLTVEEARRALRVLVSSFGDAAVKAVISTPGSSSVYHDIDALDEQNAKNKLEAWVKQHGHESVADAVSSAKVPSIS